MKPSKVVETFITYSYGTWRLQRDWKKALHIKYGKGAYLYDESGKAYLDFSAGLACVNLGYGNERIIEAVKEQVEKLAYLAPAYATDIRAEAAEELIKVLPDHLKKFVTSNSGAEANEDALKIIRMYKAPAYKVIARYQSYHGSTAGAISLTGDPRRTAVEVHTNVRGTVFMPDPFCYRCPFNLEYPKCELACLRYLEYILKNEGNVAAIFLEPVTGTNGVIIPPKEFYEGIKELTKEYDVLLVVDEVMSGWCRTGKWFAHQHWDLKPDILTTAKGATSSYIPLGITATTKEIADFFEDKFLAVGHTFAYHPVAMAALKAAIEEYRSRNINSHVERMGKYLDKRLEELKERHKSVGDVRGIGLFWALEIVKNRKTKKPFNTREDKILGRPFMTAKIASKLLEYGVIMSMAWITHFVIAPPLIVNEEDIDKGIEAFDQALKIADAEVEE